MFYGVAKNPQNKKTFLNNIIRNKKNIEVERKKTQLTNKIEEKIIQK